MGNSLYTHLPRYIVVRLDKARWAVAELLNPAAPGKWKEPDYQTITPGVGKKEVEEFLDHYQAEDLKRNGPSGGGKVR